MRYSLGHPVRLFGGRLALDFVNTADWSADGEIVDEKISSHEDLEVWQQSVGLTGVRPTDDIEGLLKFRNDLRRLLIGEGSLETLNNVHLDNFRPTRKSHSVSDRQSLMAVIAVSAIAMLSDPREHTRVKTCPAEKCGWLFLDETKNGRRTWCSMETCGNRAKAARHYARRKQTPESK